MLMALSILAMLMTSVGAAIQASMTSYRANENIASATQIGRMTLSRMMREVRTCADMDSTATRLTITSPNDGSGSTLIVYELSGTTLLRTRTVNGTTTSQVLIGSGDDSVVQAFSVLREDDLQGDPVSVTVRLALSVKGQAMDMTSSATLRKGQFD